MERALPKWATERIAPEVTGFQPVPESYIRWLLVCVLAIDPVDSPTPHQKWTLVWRFAHLPV